MKSKVLALVLLLLVSIFTQWAAKKREGCTTAIIHGEAAKQGVPILWKNRDTGFLSNKVIYVNEMPHSYMGLVNEKETSGRWVYAGLNCEGFGIMNSVAYNLPKKTGEMEDLEGQIMADALRTCRTVDDFESYIQKNLGETLGSWANFGVIDALGSAVIFEVHNHGYKKSDAADTADKYIINSNFSLSGEEGKGAGYLRFDRASFLFKQLPAGKISHQDILQKISRDFGHMLLDQPTLADLTKLSAKKPVWVLSRDTINRTSTSAAVVICGKKPGDKDSIATFWVLLGEPVTSISVPVWVEAKESPLPLHEGKIAPLCKQAFRIKKIIRPFPQRDKKNYMQVTLLNNREKTGFLPLILKTEKEIFQETAHFLKSKHTAAEFAMFQSKMAQMALEVLKSIK
ncbi:MAG: hypothetical protein PVH61_06105 [Candidatus Aminicenantes bacterium]|jgi:hypothetical protein